MYSYATDPSTGRVLVPDLVDLFNKVTYEVLAHTVLGSEWMSIMTSFGMLQLCSPICLCNCNALRAMSREAD
jgi:hypothetical protein